MMLITCSIFKALPHNDSWCMMQWYAVSSLVTFSSCIFSRILPTNPLFRPHIAGAPSVVNPTSLSHGSPILSTHLDTSSNRSFPVVVPCIECYQKNSSVTHRLESTPRMKIDSWAVSEVSVLSSTAREYAMKAFPFPTSCCWRLAARWRTWSATVFRLRLTFKNACLFFWAHGVANFNHAVFDKFPSVKGRDDFAISAATIKLALTAASLCDLALVNIACCDTRLLFNSSTFCSLCVVSRCLYLSWCLIS